MRVSLEVFILGPIDIQLLSGAFILWQKQASKLASPMPYWWFVMWNIQGFDRPFRDP